MLLLVSPIYCLCARPAKIGMTAICTHDLKPPDTSTCYNVKIVKKLTFLGR